MDERTPALSIIHNHSVIQKHDRPPFCLLPSPTFCILEPLHVKSTHKTSWSAQDTTPRSTSPSAHTDRHIATGTAKTKTTDSRSGFNLKNDHLQATFTPSYLHFPNFDHRQKQETTVYVTPSPHEHMSLFNKRFHLSQCSCRDPALKAWEIQITPTQPV